MRVVCYYFPLLDKSSVVIYCLGMDWRGNTAATRIEPTATTTSGWKASRTRSRSTPAMGASSTYCHYCHGMSAKGAGHREWRPGMVLASYSTRISRRSGSLILGFLPPVRPRAQVAARPAWWRSRISFRSNSAKAAKTWNVSFPAAGQSDHRISDPDATQYRPCADHRPGAYRQTS